ncbi:MAG: glycosyl hydrolase 115 family protein [Lachnospiraceae bacterium]|nr:glycosyl hydrolase 115 family protein [Lachnospiraceae bacterium]
MNNFNLLENNTIADLIVESSAPNGVKLVAETVLEDLHLVSGINPLLLTNAKDAIKDRVVIAMTFGQSALADYFVKNSFINIGDIIGKRECYIMKTVDNPFADCPRIKQALLILGSDKRGTIYGMFRLSELCGVSPLIFWGDAMPAKKESILLDFTKPIISKEPSVKYRGFFINDEWPAFGKWCTEKYGDVNAKAYKMVFELVLRLKGNYLWPAMWNSSFSQDGPGLLNAELANDYGIVMGSSHHEPLCRAGVEWQRQYENYGDDNTWSFLSNSTAITEFWKDGIIRNKEFENVITIGMRGENDSHLMGEDATIQDNIDILKRAITVQNQLIKEHINPNLKEVPRMLAIYKEVEDFYFGINGCDGLKGFSELDDVILLYSDDNYGNLRAIPSPDEKPHLGGQGIYYHFDYHGGPVSYEWLNFTNLAKAWEQLTMAYEYGIREMWIVNVGDVKGKEYSLSFFMDLAYDFDKWGISNLNSASEYTDLWLNKQFGGIVSDELKNELHKVLDAYTMWSTVRIPESLDPDVFKNNFHELENVYNAVNKISEKVKNLHQKLPAESIAPYESMIYYPSLAFFNTLLINLKAGMNHINAKRGALAANNYAVKLKELISLDKHYITKFHEFLGGKWNHMMDSAHMCFKNWDDDDWCYPIIKTIHPIPHAKIMVSFRGSDVHNLGHHWQERFHIHNAEMTRPDKNAIILDIDSRGDIEFKYSLTCDKAWLSFSQTQGKSELAAKPRISIDITCDRSQLNGYETALIQIGFLFENGDKKQAFLNVSAGNKDFSAKGAYLEADGYICIPADGYSRKTDVSDMGFSVIPRLGRTGNALKSFPVTKSWVNEDKRPGVRYDFIVAERCNYIVTFYFSPRNPIMKGGRIKGCYSLNDGMPALFDIVPDDFYAEHFNADWCSGVMNNIRKMSVEAVCNEGLNYLNFYAADANVLLENIVISPKDTPLPETHLAPPESYRL